MVGMGGKRTVYLFSAKILLANEPDWKWVKATQPSFELGGRMFEDEYDLAMAVIQGVESRSQQGGYSTERFKFNST